MKSGAIVVIFVVHPVTPPEQLHTLTSASIVGIIPARYASIRLPGKPLVDIAGRPMVEHVYRRAASASSVQAVVVATDDDRIYSAVEAFGGVARMTRSTHRSGTDRVAEVARELTCELIVNIQGDVPLIEPALIDQALAPFANDASVVISTLRRRIEDPAELSDPNVVKVVCDQAGDALYFSRAPIPHSVVGSTTTCARAAKHIGIYVYRRTTLLELAALEPTALEVAESLEQLRALEHGYRIRTVETTFDPLTVDTASDLERVRRLATAGARV